VVVDLVVAVALFCFAFLMLCSRSSLPFIVLINSQHFLGLRRLVDTGNVRSARFEEGTGRILFDITPHSAASHEAAKYTAHGLPQVSGSGSAEVYAMVSRNRSRSPLYLYTRHLPDPQLISRLLAAGVEFGTLRASVTSSLTRILATALALWIPLIPMFIIMRRFLDGRSGGAKRSRNKSDKNADVPFITFDDVAGVGAAKAELQEVVACLKDPRIFARLGAKLPSGVLLCGPPGTGKTLLAKAVAGEAGVPFLAVSASEFVELFVGRGAARVRELFAEARKRAPCVVFIDELDAVGGRRGAGLNEERDQTLNQLLTELDGFDGRPGVVLLAATNRPDVLDQALLRPGRLSRRVTVPLPDEVGRAAILSVHLRAVKLEGGDEATPQAAALLARITPGFSGADLANLCNEAAFLGIRRGAESVSLEDLITAVNRQRFGVNGGEGSGSNNLISWAQKLQGWLIDASSSAESTRSSPLGS
jgi:ATP-dependent Zn protease